MDDHHTHVCAECGVRFTPTNQYAEMCSGACRERRRRARARAQQIAEMKRAAAALAALQALAGPNPDPVYTKETP